MQVCAFLTGDSISFVCLLLSGKHTRVYVHVMQVIMNNLICRRQFHTHLHMSVLQDNCHIATKLCGRRGIYSDLKFVYVCKPHCIHVFMSMCVFMHV